MQFTFRKRLFYLYLAQYEAENPDEAEEYIGTGYDDPAARAQLDESFEEVVVEREHAAMRVGAQRLAADEEDQRGHDEHADQDGDSERERFEFEARQREVPIARAKEPVEQFGLSPRGVPPDDGKARA